jgi:hypothetical protein
VNLHYWEIAMAEEKGGFCMNGKDLLRISKKVVKTNQPEMLDEFKIDEGLAQSFIEWYDTSGRAEKKRILKLSGNALLRTLTGS